MQETEAESYEALLKSKESEAVKAAEEGFKIRLKEELATNLAAKEKEFEEQVRLVSDLGLQLAAMKRERDEALELKESMIKGFDDKLKSVREELTTSKREVSEQRQIAKEAVEKLAEMEKAKVFVYYFSVDAYLLKCVCRQRMLRTFPRCWLPRKKCFRPRTMIMRAFRPS